VEAVLKLLAITNGMGTAMQTESAVNKRLEVVTRFRVSQFTKFLVQIDTIDRGTPGTNTGPSHPPLLGKEQVRLLGVGTSDEGDIFRFHGEATQIILPNKSA
jgi:hypothetical protein